MKSPVSTMQLKDLQREQAKLDALAKEGTITLEEAERLSRVRDAIAKIEYITSGKGFYI